MTDITVGIFYVFSCKLIEIFEINFQATCNFNCHDANVRKVSENNDIQKDIKYICIWCWGQERIFFFLI